MDLQDFKDALDELGISHHESGQSLRIKTCPACGSEKYKVHLRAVIENDMFFGRCYSGKCQTNFSSLKFLLMAGMGRNEAMRLHGIDREESLNFLPKLNDLTKEVKELKKENVQPDTNISSFFKIKDWLEHPVSRYAIKRGINPDWSFIMIDHETSAVVFVVYEDKKVLGYQKRFLKPSDTNMKTKTSYGFKKTEHILVFNNPGKDILVCEGPFTAVSAWHYGYTGICTFGAGVSEKQINKIVQLSEKMNVNVGVAFDDDEAGEKGATRIRSAMFWLGKKTFKVLPSLGNDLNDSWQAGANVVVKKEKYEYNPAVPELKGFI